MENKLIEFNPILSCKIQISHFVRDICTGDKIKKTIKADGYQQDDLQCLDQPNK